MNQYKFIEMICYELEDHDEAISLVKTLDSSALLYELLDHYNWDDGFGVPIAVANHPCCEVAIAQKLYWLAAADYWYESEEEVNIYNKEHFNFSKLISQRLLAGYYEVGSLSHAEYFSQVQLYKFKKQGFPDVFYQPVVGTKSKQHRQP
ncbi:DUF4274 domain-containing protein [Shewanella woodyi]|uniref:DUF4274 domain-containing protein n=1 Tax=Shewanella woodyi (strain ATCC 51908 / MS32) TaxID=392500 RepID=B1KR00_SHEWM|nr:DUF4274 domain-containing protein [Shewanella woodyi]ACA87756.1 conserved hypothetical protein [Shewanella woodyi ATCC 51908]